METTRQQKIARLIQKELASIFQLSSKRWFGNALITVTKVSVTKDMSLARVYVSLFSTQDKLQLFELVRHHTREIRTEMAANMRLQLRIIPQIEFFLDDSLDYIDNIERLLKE